MFKVKVNSREYKVEKGVDGETFVLDGKEIKPDIVKISNDNFHIINNNQSYTVEVLERNSAEKKFIIRVNNNKYELELKDQYDELLHKLGMDAGSIAKINDLKAPMPGLVVDVLVHDGQVIKKGDSLIILEAMKMENVLKAGADATVKKVSTSKGARVEKNEILIQFSS